MTGERRMKSHELRVNLRGALRYVEGGGTVIVEHYNRPVARIVPIEPPDVDQANDRSRS